MSWIAENVKKLKEALFKTNNAINIAESNIEGSDIDIQINEDFYDDLFEKLLKSDVGFDFSEEIIGNLKSSVKEKTLSRVNLNLKIKDIVKEKIDFSGIEKSKGNSAQKIFLIVGVNGSGKTTSIGKLANFFKEDGNKVLVVAGDTFRAAGASQAALWAKKANVDVHYVEEVKKPDAVIYEAIKKAETENYNIVLIDTAGRLQAQKNLMDELQKINNVVEKNKNLFSIERLIVLDSTIGQNAIVQAKEFSKVVPLDGIILSKLDGSAKGGVVLNIMNELKLPVKYVGTGERVEDIVNFDFNEYLESIFF